jgi:putative acetyltransferase
MVIRSYRSSDCATLAQIYYDTIHTANAADYTPAQLDAWATGNVDLQVWDNYFLTRNSFVAEIDGKIVGFSDIDDTGYLGRLYVHKDYLGRGIGKALCDAAEMAVDVPKYTLHSSITARPFYEKQGYRTVEVRQMERKDQFLTIYVMEKTI